MRALTLFLLLLNLCSFADDNTTVDGVLSQNKTQQFKYDKEKNNAEASKLRDSWIAPILLNYSYMKSNPTKYTQTDKSFSVKINQPIFQSGGIYFGIKYADAFKKYSNTSVKVAKRKVIKGVVSIYLQIKKLDLQIKKQKLNIANTNIKLEQNKELYLSGHLESGFLDNSIINKNNASLMMYDLKTQKEKLIAQFVSLSDRDYKTLSLPLFKNLSKDEFLKNNLVLKQHRHQIQKDRYFKNVKVAKYLPKVSLTGGYNWFESDLSPDLSYYNYGVSLSMPLDINSFKDVESSEVDYLKSKLLLADKKREEISLFEQVQKNLKNYDFKISLSRENLKLYEKLLDDTKQLFEAGYKSKYDVELLQNSCDISKLDVEIYALDKQLELLNLYEVYEKI